VPHDIISIFAPPRNKSWRRRHCPLIRLKPWWGEGNLSQTLPVGIHLVVFVAPWSSRFQRLDCRS